MLHAQFSLKYTWFLSKSASCLPLSVLKNRQLTDRWCQCLHTLFLPANDTIPSCTTRCVQGKENLGRNTKWKCPSRQSVDSLFWMLRLWAPDDPRPSPPLLPQSPALITALKLQNLKCRVWCNLSRLMYIIATSLFLFTYLFLLSVTMWANRASGHANSWSAWWSVQNVCWVPENVFEELDARFFSVLPISLTGRGFKASVYCSIAGKYTIFHGACNIIFPEADG